MLRNLQAEIIRKDIDPMDIAKSIKVSDKTLRNKISERTPFTYPEAKLVRDNHFPDMTLEYLFTSDKTAKPKAG